MRLVTLLAVLARDMVLQAPGWRLTASP
jgi:hypothetical protein